MEEGCLYFINPLHTWIILDILELVDVGNGERGKVNRLAGNGIDLEGCGRSVITIFSIDRVTDGWNGGSEILGIVRMGWGMFL